MTKDPQIPPESVIEMLLSPATLRRLLESQDDDARPEVLERFRRVMRAASVRVVEY